MFCNKKSPIYFLSLMLTCGVQAGEIKIEDIEPYEDWGFDLVTGFNINVPTTQPPFVIKLRKFNTANEDNGLVSFEMQEQIIDKDPKVIKVPAIFTFGVSSKEYKFTLNNTQYIKLNKEFISINDTNDDKIEYYKKFLENSFYGGVETYLLLQSIKLFQKVLPEDKKPLLKSFIQMLKDVYERKASEENKNKLTDFIQEKELDALHVFLLRPELLSVPKDAFNNKIIALNLKNVEKTRDTIAQHKKATEEQFRQKQPSLFSNKYKWALGGGLTAAALIGLYWLTQNQERFKNLAPFLSRMWFKGGLYDFR